MPQIMNIRRMAVLLTMLAAITMGSAAIAKADTFTFVGTANGESVNAKADLTRSGNTITVVLTNLLSPAAINSAGQGLSGLRFAFCDPITHAVIPGLTFNSFVSQNGRLVAVNADGSITDKGANGSGADALTWAGSNSAGGFQITALGSTGVFGTNPPDELILPAASSYPGANSSIAGNDPHNPFVDGPGTFIFTVSGTIPANAVFCNVILQFGTNGEEHAAVPVTTVPEPASMLLLGTGLIGIAGFARRRFKK